MWDWHDVGGVMVIKLPSILCLEASLKMEY